MKLEVGKKYTDGLDVVEVKFLDYEGTAWCLSNRNYCKYIHKDESDWREVVDKPDSGEGWRLLEPDEDVEAGDEYFSVVAGKWLITNNHRSNKGKQTSGIYYRRRIAPKYVPYTWDDRDELRGRWYRKKGDNVEVLVTHLTKRDSTDVSINSWSSDSFLLCCEWLDGTPCGKKVV
jgi:hypothetical protein